MKFSLKGQRKHFQPRTRIVALLLPATLLISACGFYYPKEVEFYDPECQIIAKKYVLEGVGISGVGVSCHNEGCLIALIPAAASAVVSGSIVVAGNAIHWLEKKGQCKSKNSDD